MADGALANKIYIGSLTEPTYRFYNTNLWSGLSGMFEVDVLCNELSIDEFTFTVKYKSVTGMVYRPTDALEYRDINGLFYGWIFYGIPEKDYLTNVAYGTPVWWFVEGEFFAKGYIKSIERTGRYAWKVVCQSAIGLLDAQNSVGGMYTGETFVSVLADIVGAQIITPTPPGNTDPGYILGIDDGDTQINVDFDVGGLPVYGHLPYDTRRNNLHTLLFSAGAVIERDNQYIEYKIKFPSMVGTEIPSSRISLNGSVSVQESSNQADVTEHYYVALATDLTETLFDNTNGTGNADHELITFSDPMHDLVADGVTINESNCNYAIVSGTGTVTGQKYTHVEKIVSLSNAEEGDSIRAKRVESNGLISAANSLNTARRVLSYFSSARTLKSKILLDNEKPGILLSLNDAFGDPTTAYLKKANVLITTLKGADCEMIEGYVPAWGGNNYTNRIFVTESGTITIPDGVKAIRLILIQGGSGGEGGLYGERGYGKYPALTPKDPGDFNEDQKVDNPDPAYWYLLKTMSIVKKPIGGDPGTPGEAGKIFVIDLETNGGESVSFTIGAGGNGGSARETTDDDGSGTEGGETSATIGAETYSSANGSRSAFGFVDMLGDAVFAMPGENGHKGGDGGLSSIEYAANPDSPTYWQWFGKAGDNGGGVGTNNGGQGGSAIKAGGSFLFYNSASGGGGGGAAWGANGENGGNPTWDSYNERLTTGTGGDGANAVAPPKPTYGNGGGGGNGGGAGGNVAPGVVYGYRATDLTSLILGFKTPPESATAGQHGGKSGKGSKGGDGGDGCAIIYY